MSTQTEETSRLRDLATQIGELRRRLLEPLETGRFQIRERGEDVTEREAALLRDTLVEIEAALAQCREPETVSENRAVLRARPLEGEIDHRTITREIISRFPKILEALAK